MVEKRKATSGYVGCTRGTLSARLLRVVYCVLTICLPRIATPDLLLNLNFIFTGMLFTQVLLAGRIIVPACETGDAVEKTNALTGSINTR